MLRTTLAGERVYLFTGCWWLRLLGADGLTLWRAMFFRAHRVQVTAGIIGHELVHVRRWVAGGVIRWPLRHLWDLVRHGYRASAEERIAYAEGPTMAQHPDVQGIVRILRGGR